MNAFLNRVWHLRTGELKFVLILGFALLGNSLAQKVSEIASISNFLSDVGVPQFLLVLIASSIISIFMTGLQSLLIDRFDRVTLLCTVSFSLGIIFIILRILFLFGFPEWLNYGLLYLLSDLQFTFFPLAFWILANDIYEPAQAQRLFPILSTWSLIGNLLGIGITALSPTLFSRLDAKPEELLMLNILVYLIVYILMQVGFKNIKLRSVSLRQETIRETLNEGQNFIQEVPAFRYLILSILAVIICETIIDFRFFVVSESAFSDVNSYQTFFSLFTLVRIISYITIQSFLTRWLLSVIQLKNAFLIQPFCSLAAASCTLAIPSLGGSIAGVVLQKLPQYTIDETARKAIQGLVPEERRGRVCLFMDSYLTAGGAIIAATLTLLVIVISEKLNIPNYFYIYSAIALLSSFVAIGSILKVRSVYDSSLFNWRLKRRQRAKNILDKIDF